MSSTLVAEDDAEEGRLEALAAESDPAGGRVACRETAAPVVSAMALRHP
jgi:hypothetical protein